MKLATPITIEELQQTSLLSDSAKTWALDNLTYLNAPMKLFGKSMKTKNIRSATPRGFAQAVFNANNATMQSLHYKCDIMSTTQHC